MPPDGLSSYVVDEELCKEFELIRHTSESKLLAKLCAFKLGPKFYGIVPSDTRLVEDQPSRSIQGQVCLEWQYVFRELVWREIADLKAIGQARGEGQADTPATSSQASDALAGFQLEQRNARTIRMLLLLESLFCRDIIARLPSGISKNVADGIEDVFGQVPKLTELVDRLWQEAIPFLPRIEARWQVFVPFLLILAVRHSQDEWLTPGPWEALGALRVSDLLQREWGNLAQSGQQVCAFCRKFVAFLVLNQSAVGQYVRETGNDRFRIQAQQLAANHGHRLGEQAILDALAIMAILEEARNHHLPGVDSEFMLGSLRINIGVKRSWDEEDWYSRSRPVAPRRPWELPQIVRCKENANRGTARTPAEVTKRILLAIEPPSNPPLGSGRAPMRNTWGYASEIQRLDEELDSHGMRDFQEVVGWCHRTQPGPMSYSFGRQQVHDLGQLLQAKVKAVSAAVAGVLHRLSQSPPRAAAQAALLEGSRVFRTYFEFRERELDLSPILAPAQSSERHQATFVEIVLKDRFAAWGLLFPEAPPAETLDGKPADDSAADLLRWLFQAAREHLGLSADKLKGGSCYVPLPLIQRILDVVGRLRPNKCLTVMVSYTNGPLEVIQIPENLDEEQDVELVSLIANYVHARLLNRAMTVGIEGVDIAVAVTHQTDGPPATGLMTADRWQKHVKEAYENRGYHVLVEKYIQDYNTTRRTVQFGYAPPTSHLDPVTPWNVRGALQDWAQANLRGLPVLILGLDIGATLVKAQFYRYGRGGMLVPVGEAVPFDRPKRKEAQKPLGSGAFADLIVERIEAIARANDQLRNMFMSEKKRAVMLCVGVAWPGPVRDHHVAGTSSIYELFGSTQILENKIEDILKVDIAQALTKRLATSPFLTGGRPISPFVGLVNDGDADGYGLLASWQVGDRHRSEDSPTVAVVKLGSGIATAIFERWGIKPGLWEGGKLVLDLAADPDRNFPTGLANAYLSKKTLPAVALGLAESREVARENFFHVRNLDSEEIGLFLDVTPHEIKDLQKLTEAFGLHGLAAHWNVDVAKLRHVYRLMASPRGTLPSRPELQLASEVHAKLGLTGKLAVERLQELVSQHGRIRLALTVGAADDSRRCSKEIGRFKKSVATKAVQALGRYLGDFLVLCASFVEVDAFVTSGGVLQGGTRAEAIKQACDRARQYGLCLSPEGTNLLRVLERPSWLVGPRKPAEKALPAPVQSAPHHQRMNMGTFGAAVFALAEFLVDRKRRGSQVIREALHRLSPNEEVILSEEELQFPKDHVIQCKEEHCLSKEEIQKLLNLENFMVQVGIDKYVRMDTSVRKS